jgi:hypothetical protein
MNLKKVANILEEKPDLLIRSLVLNEAERKKQIIYGARALNVQLPTYLRKETADYDILTKTPKKSAKELINKLKKHTSRDIELKSAKHKGTYKVKINGKTIVDYTQLKKTPKTKKVYGVRYYDVKSIKKNIQRRLKDKSKEFRKEKDLDALKRIKLSEDTFNF